MFQIDTQRQKWVMYAVKLSHSTFTPGTEPGKAFLIIFKNRRQNCEGLEIKLAGGCQSSGGSNPPTTTLHHFAPWIHTLTETSAISSPVVRTIKPDGGRTVPGEIRSELFPRRVDVQPTVTFP